MTEEQTQMVEENLPLVAHLVGKYFPQGALGMDYDDLVQEGSIGLMRAVEHYDDTKGYKFASYASRVILNTVITRLRRGKMRQEARWAETSVRLDASGGANADGMTLAEAIPDPSSLNRSTVNYDAIWSILDNTNPVSRMMWIGHYLEGYPQTELAKRFNLSRQAVSTRLENVNKRMRVRLKP